MAGGFKAFLKNARRIKAMSGIRSHFERTGSPFAALGMTRIRNFTFSGNGTLNLVSKTIHS
jgi:hypothetical protein